MREFISLLISPLPILYILLISALVFRLAKWKKTTRFFLILAALWFLAITTRPFPYLLTNNLEKQYRQLTDAEIENIPDSVNIIVLGGGFTDDTDLAPNNQILVISLARLTEGIRIHKSIPGSTLITSGAGKRSSLSGAELMYRTALILGVDSSDLELSNLPLTTQSEADQYLQNFGNRKKLVLVTSAVHMPRSVMLFRSKGLDIIPAPGDFLIRRPTVRYPFNWLPAADNVRILEQAMHEYGGILWFRLGGR